MRRLAEVGAIAVLILGGAWLATVVSWVRRFEAADFHE